MQVRPGAAVDRSTVDEPSRRRLAAALRKAVRGDVLFDEAHRAGYASDSSNYRQVPLGVVRPRDEADVIETVRVCREFGAPVLGRGAGTSLAGQGCNVAVVIDMSRYLTAILDIDPIARTARVQPGVVLDDLRRAVAPYGLTFGPDPATHAWCTIGGMVGNNSCGTHALYAGKTIDNVHALTAITYDGARLELGPCDDRTYAEMTARGGTTARVYAGLKEIGRRYGDLIRERFPQIPRRVSGYSLEQLLPENGFHVARALVGSESTCALVTEITVALHHNPTHRRLVVLGFEDVYHAADQVPHLLRHKLIGLEGFDDVLVAHMRAAGLNLAQLELLPPGNGWLLAEFGDNDPAVVDEQIRMLMADLPPKAQAIAYSDPDQQRGVWAIRESALGATARPPGLPHHLEGWEDAAVAPERLGTYLRGIRRLWEKFGYSGAWYGHFGQGCVHTRNNFDLSSVEGLRQYRAYVEQAADLVVSLGGSLSGEHGDGQARGELLNRMFGDELVNAMRQFKAVWDPEGRMNPGKIVDAYPLDSNIRFGPSWTASPLRPTGFSFAADGGSLQSAVQRCVGVGRCRRDDTGVMCPSYRATREELHSTRGRANLLVEMFRGEVTPATWRNRAVREALDLCLSCKGCAAECPTGVDMATYKAEFLHHYYRGRLRPRAAYSLALVPWLARVATRVPRIANALLGEHATGRTLRRLAGVSTRRSAPRLATRAFRRSRRAAPIPAESSVVVWPDTFSDAFWPERAAATVALLEAVGQHVAVPTQWACCGRPLYDAGMLALARHTLRDVLRVLRPWLAAGVPIVVPEPSCLAAFRDELPRLLPAEPLAAKLASTARSLAEHLVAIDWQPHRRVTGVRVYLHVHCHQRAVGGFAADQEVLTRAGYDVTVLDSGCCGLAGSFGFRAEHDELSRQIAANQFLPALATVDDKDVLVIDGFSCATQAAQLGARSGTSLAELLTRHLA